VGVVVVAAAGVGGFFALGSRARPEQPGGAKPAVSPVDTVRIQDTVRVPVATPQPPRSERSRPRGGTAPPPPAPVPAAALQGYLTIDASPFGEVYIDGVDVGQTPVVEYAVPPGRHAIRIEHPGFKTVTETVQVEKTAIVRKRYALLPESP